MKTLLSINSGLFFLILTAFFSCQKPPEYDNVPHIEFKNVEKYSSLENNVKKDSLVIVTRFEDGDGDLGLSEEMAKSEPYNQGDNNINYFINIYIKKNGTFELLNLPFSFNGRFFPLAPDGRVGPIEGDLKYGGIVIRANNPLVKPGDVLRFVVYIRDRALNTSNTITTSEVTVFTP